LYDEEEEGGEGQLEMIYVIKTPTAILSNPIVKFFKQICLPQNLSKQNPEKFD